MSQPAPPAQNNDLVYCHECENEWYRREHGLTCPDCHSDFTEIVEAGHDPRNDDLHIPADDPAEAELEELRGHNPWADAADPDDGDIGGVGYGGRGGAGAGAGGLGGGFGGGAGGMQGGGLMGLLGNMIGGFGGAMQQAQQAQQGAPQNQQPEQGGGGPRTRHIQGPGYSFTMTTSGGGGAAGNLFPRNAHQPQPFNGQPDQMDRMMQQMLTNIGVFPGLPNQHQHPHHHDPHNPHGGGPFAGPQNDGMFPANLFQLLGLPPGMAGGVHGDAVYSQEALDRIVTQLMEQHTSGNAPGPASSSAIESLPTRQITREDTGESSDTADCSICMDGVPLGAQVTVLPCKHWFHADCVRAWLQEHDSCPHCRQGIVAKDSNAEGQTGQGGRVRGEDEQPLHDQNAWQVPGAFPDSTTGGRGTRESPFTVPESSRGVRGSAGSSSAAGVFGRMRDAFGGGSDSSGAGPGSSNGRS